MPLRSSAVGPTQSYRVGGVRRRASCEGASKGKYQSTRYLNFVCRCRATRQRRGTRPFSLNPQSKRSTIRTLGLNTPPLVITIGLPPPSSEPPRSLLLYPPPACLKKGRVMFGRQNPKNIEIISSHIPEKKRLLFEVDAGEKAVWFLT